MNYDELLNTREAKILKTMQSSFPKDYLKSIHPLLEIAQKVAKIYLPIEESLQKHMEWIRPIREAADKLQLSANELSRKAELISTFHTSVAKRTMEIANHLTAIEKLSEAQFVFWEFMPTDFIEIINSTKDINTELFQFESLDDFGRSNSIIQSCLQHPFVDPIKILFNQTIDAYKSELYSLAVLGCTAIIDNTLSLASDNPTHKNFARYKTLLDKTKDLALFNNDDYALFTLLITFERVAKSLYNHQQFDEKNEPKSLNRHWIVHGRSKKEYTQLDFIKLIYFLYGIILIDKIARE